MDFELEYDAWQKLEKQIVKKMRKDESCFVWTGAKTNYGYGRVCFKGKEYKTHVLVYQLFKNDRQPVGGFVRHTCGNLACINPEHLFVSQSRR